MKDSPYKIFLLVLAVVLILLPWQWAPALTLGSYEVKNVTLLSDVLSDSTSSTTRVPLPPPPAPPVAPSGDGNQATETSAPKPCPKGTVCIEDYADASGRGMRPLYDALSKAGSLGRPVRIAYFGDSFIEVDILTSSLRALLQNKFGGHGVGWLDMAPPYAANRPTVTQRYGGWDTRCVLNKGTYSRNNLNVGQRYFIPRGTAWTEIKGVKRPNLDTTEVHTLYLRSSGPVTAGVKLDGGPMLALHGQGGRIEALSRTGRAGTVRWQVSGSGVICWGVAEESRKGVIVDNFSLRGSSGVTLAEIPAQNLAQLNAVRPYDLIVLQFGLNVASKTQTNYSNYVAQMKRVVALMKQCFPKAGILIVGVGDRENRLADGQLHTLPGVLALMRYQQNMAADCHVAYWDLYKGMGGEGAMRRMAAAKPAEAGKDYTHINFYGGERVARQLFKSIVYGYQQYTQGHR